MIGLCSRGMIHMSTNSITNEQFIRFETPNKISRVYFCLKVRRNGLNSSFDGNVQRFVLKCTWNSSPNKFSFATHRLLSPSYKSHLNLNFSVSLPYFNLTPLITYLTLTWLSVITKIISDGFFLSLCFNCLLQVSSERLNKCAAELIAPTCSNVG